MRQWVFLAIVVAVAGFAGWLVWENRSSEKLVSTSLSLLFAAALGAIVNVLVFSVESHDSVEFPVMFLLRRDTGALFQLPPMLSRPVAWYSWAPETLEKQSGPERFAKIKPTTLEAQQKFYFQLLQWAVFDALQHQYRFSWKIRKVALKTPYGNVERSQGESVANAVTISNEEIRTRLLAGNVFADVPSARGPANLVLPPGMELSREQPTSDAFEVVFTFRSRMLTTRINVEGLSWGVGIGSYGTLLGLSAEEAQAQFAMAMYVIRVDTTAKGYFQGNPDLPALKAWAKQVAEVLQAELDENVRWEALRNGLEARQLAPVAAEVMRERR